MAANHPRGQIQTDDRQNRDGPAAVMRWSTGWGMGWGEEWERKAHGAGAMVTDASAMGGLGRAGVSLRSEKLWKRRACKAPTKRAAFKVGRGDTVGPSVVSAS